ncbi:hypothetical protein H696_00701 [Fonticula alba]|uniref:Phosphatidylinositol 3,4,5-trisphosphate 3-phosphatase and dual-specificity protein phosphatase PTEN n=1 Tax=Fonticula alba TaxID=691883 RepID=A0A058ZFJ0_FONAL|nr:hypothetical protein H696_00701 [Fonticula alba]KCV73155.1 hypothetical protein H696_00701 [Fonticula alba]|eukprot:XP_009492856.1 hypothetical protein H696_00701 [Fonticula alba]
MSTFARKLVSKKKRRFVTKDDGGFDLDLTYVTPNIIAMGFPSESFEGVYRNPMSSVVRFLDSRHPERYRVYNLCSERCYDPSKFYGRVARFPFDDHNAPMLSLIPAFCEDAASWLSQHPDNVIAVHCKAGKGRTGVMICAYLLYSRQWQVAAEALAFYGAARTENGKGVTIPSQQRYIDYFAMMLSELEAAGHTLPLISLERPAPLSPTSLGTVVAAITDGPLPVAPLTVPAPYRYVPRTLLLENIVLGDLLVGSSSSLHPFAVVYCNEQKIDTTAPFTVTSTCKKTVSLTLSPPLPVFGDVRVEFFTKDKFKKSEKLFHMWFNTFFIPADGVLSVPKSGIDKACKDKKHAVYSENLSIKISLSVPVGSEDVSIWSAPTTAAATASSPASPVAAAPVFVAHETATAGAETGVADECTPVTAVEEEETPVAAVEKSPSVTEEALDEETAEEVEPQQQAPPPQEVATVSEPHEPEEEEEQEPEPEEESASSPVAQLPSEEAVTEEAPAIDSDAHETPGEEDESTAPSCDVSVADGSPASLDEATEESEGAGPEPGSPVGSTLSVSTTGSVAGCGAASGPTGHATEAVSSPATVRPAVVSAAPVAAAPIIPLGDSSSDSLSEDTDSSDDDDTDSSYDDDDDDDDDDDSDDDVSDDSDSD